MRVVGTPAHGRTSAPTRSRLLWVMTPGRSTSRRYGTVSSTGPRQCPSNSRCAAAARWDSAASGPAARHAACARCTHVGGPSPIRNATVHPHPATVVDPPYRGASTHPAGERLRRRDQVVLSGRQVVDAGIGS